MRPLRYLLALACLLSLGALFSGGCSSSNPEASHPTTIEVSPDMITRETAYHVNPSAQWVIVRNGGDGSMQYTSHVASGNTWIGLFNQTSGIAPDSFVVNFQVNHPQSQFL